METKNVLVFDNSENVIDRYIVIKENGDGFMINHSPFSFPDNCYGFFGNVLEVYKQNSLEDFLLKAKTDKIIGKYVNDKNNLPDEVKEFINSL